jgi:hypothetical protein
MSPKVNEHQSLQKADGKFVMKGPTGEWESDESRAAISFVITQSKSGAVAAGMGESVVYDRPSDGASFMWTADVQHLAGPPFHPGPADVHAWAWIAEGADLGTYDCDVAITIDP